MGYLWKAKTERALRYNKSKMVAQGETLLNSVGEKIVHWIEWLICRVVSEKPQPRFVFPGASKWIIQGVSYVKNWAKEHIHTASLNGFEGVKGCTHFGNYFAPVVPFMGVLRPSDRSLVHHHPATWTKVGQGQSKAVRQNLQVNQEKVTTDNHPRKPPS